MSNEMMTVESKLEEWSVLAAKQALKSVLRVANEVHAAPTMEEWKALTFEAQMARGKAFLEQVLVELAAQFKVGGYAALALVDVPPDVRIPTIHRNRAMWEKLWKEAGWDEVTKEVKL